MNTTPNEAPAEARPIGGTGAGPTTLAQFVNLDEPDMRVIDLKASLAVAFRRLRQASGLTQEAIATRMSVKRSQVARLESLGSASVPTLDVLVAAFFAVGGTSDQFCELVKRTDQAMSR